MQLGGATWEVRLGRRDTTYASREAANANIPSPFFNLSQLINNFQNHGLDEKDLVALSGAHTIGRARCLLFKDHMYNDSNIDPFFARQLQYTCSVGGDFYPVPLDPTTARFDVGYFSNLLLMRGLLHSDQELFNGGGYTDALVRQYYYNSKAFYWDFANSMIKMGNIGVLTGSEGEIRVNCRKVNNY